MKKPSREILANNIRAIAEKRFGKKFQGKLIGAGISNGTVTRVLSGKVGVSLDTLDELAEALRVPASSLLCACYDVNDPPSCIPASTIASAKAAKVMEEALRKFRESSSQ